MTLQPMFRRTFILGRNLINMDLEVAVFSVDMVAPIPMSNAISPIRLGTRHILGKNVARCQVIIRTVYDHMSITTSKAKVVH